ncbi:MAG TPA: hypothetical protein VF708_08595 [Pyrinomonadaceae bacterium]|jgi:hypothetical protein
MTEEFPSHKSIDAGTGNVCLRVADINIALTGMTPDLPLHVVGPMSQFVASAVADAPADVAIRVDWDIPDEGQDAQLLFDSGSIWKLYQLADGRYEFRLSAPFSGWQPYKVARFSADWTSGEILCQRQYFVPGKAIYPLEYPLDEVLISNLLARGRGIEIHACGLRDRDGNGYLFPGQSGAGKSTTANLWAQADEDVRVLSDERIILRLRDGRIWMYGTPWHGDAGIARPLSAPLTRIFFLGRGAQHELVPQKRAEAAARLFACSFPPFYSQGGLAFALQFLDELTQLVPCDELRFVPEPQLVEFIRAQATDGQRS